MNSALENHGVEELALLRLSGLRTLPGATEALTNIGNWKRFIWLVNEHGVAGFVQKNLADAGLTGMVPPTEYQTLRNQTFKSIARNSFVMTAMAAAAEILGRAGFVPVLLKGTALELSVYGESGLRPMSDADILLPREQCLPAWRLLQKQGYRALPFKSPLFRLIPMHTGKHLPSLIKGGFSLEIHHGLWWGKGNGLTDKMIGGKTASGVGHPAAGDDGTASGDDGTASGLTGAGLQKMAAGGQDPSVGNGINGKIPPAGLHFLYLVSHLVQHEKDGNSQLRQYNDLVAMIDYYGADEAAGVAMEHAAEVGLVEELKDKLGLLRTFMGMELPEKYHFEPSADAVNQFVSFLGNPKGNPVGDKRAVYRESIRAIPGLHRKLIYLTGDIFPGFRFMKERYEKETVWGALPYYLVRPGKLLWLFR